MEAKCKINLVITVFVGVHAPPVERHEVMMTQNFPNVVCLYKVRRSLEIFGRCQGVYIRKVRDVHYPRRGVGVCVPGPGQGHLYQETAAHYCVR